jgi:phosphoribosyl-AMP cyclohydrolase
LIDKNGRSEVIVHKKTGLEFMIEINFSKSADGLIPAIAQDHSSGSVLMLAYVNEAAWNKSLETRKAHYWSRSRGQLWLKGERSGNVQIIKDIYVDCDADCIIYSVEQIGGAACHKGYPSCFYRKVSDNDLEIVEERVFDPAEVYRTS